jgi:macrophage erythroblast attacher
MTVPVQQQQAPNTSSAALQAPDRIPPEVINYCEQSTLKIPFELARKYSRANQRILEKELPALLAAYTEKAAVDPGVEERFTERLRVVEERARANREKEVEYLRRLELRQDYLDKVLRGEAESEWIELALQRLVVEYKMDQGEMEEALRLTHLLSLHDWIDPEPYEERHKILSDLHQKQFASALHWCSDFRQSLKRGKSQLEFMLRRQEMIEMRGAGMEAISYGRKHLFPWLDCTEVNNTSKELWELAESAVKQIIFNDDKLIKESFEETCRLFVKEFNQTYMLSDPSLLVTLVRSGLTLLKTPNCGDPDHYNKACPVCQPELLAMSSDLPYAHHDSSVLVCRVTGQRMNEDNPPMALPNGNVYSLEGLRKGQTEEGRVRCVRSGSEYEWDQVRKVFIT